MSPPSQRRRQLVVFGGTVLDVQAQPYDAELQRASSVPGKVTQVPGGVGRNIAEAAHHLLQDEHCASSEHPAVLLVSVLGADAAADALMASFRQHGMGTSGIICSRGVGTPCVVAVLDRGGEVAACVADVSAPALELTPAVVQRHAGDIQRAGLVVLDANLQAPTLEAAAQAAAAAGAAVLFEPVSLPKAARCMPVLRSLSFISPNVQELLAIAGAVLQQQGRQGSALARLPQQAALERLGEAQQLLAQVAPAAAVVLREGVSHILLTLGPHGAAIFSLEPQGQGGGGGSSGVGGGRKQLLVQHVPAARVARVVSLSGAGDTLVGGFAAALLRGAPLLEAVATGVAAAAVAVGSSLNVPGPGDGLVHGTIQRQAQQLLAQAQAWRLPVGSAL